MTHLLSTIVVGFALTVSCTKAEAGAAGRCGGTGGQHTKALTCPSGQYIAGIAARGGVYVDQFSIACRNIPASGAPGELGDFLSAGPGGGLDTESAGCKEGDAVVFIRFMSGIYVDNALRALCFPRSGTGWRTEEQDHASQAKVNTGAGLAVSLAGLPVRSARRCIRSP